ncbi:MAG: DUF5615 family PIN-like protein [Acidimicrobiales bacterium]
MGERAASVVGVKLLLDEMHAPAVAADLRGRGCDAVAVKERPELIGISDHEVLVAATAEGRAVVTENVKDFAALAQRWAAAGEHHGGIVFTHPRRFRRAARNHVRVLSEALVQFIDKRSSALQKVESFVWWLEESKR